MSAGPALAARVPDRFTAAAIQFEPSFGAKADNIARLLALTVEAARAGVRLIVHPEMATTGYCWASREEIAPHVEPIPGPTTETFARIARDYDCQIVVALPEVIPATGVFYNSAALVGPDGVAGVYRKTHPYISEPKWAKDGDLGLPVFGTPHGRIAMTICMDASFPETARIPALRGADVICFPTNWLSAKSPAAEWIARALENGVYFIAANRYGRERGVQFSGGSCIIDPDGVVQSSIDTGDGIVYGEIDLARARDKRLSPDRVEDRIADRRPDAYGNITLNTYLWNARDFHGLYGLRPLPEGRRSRVAVCQLAPAAGVVGANLDRIAALAREHASADLLVFPELALTGPVGDRGAAEALAEPVPGPVTRYLREIAAAHGAFLIVGLIERAGERRYNSAVLVGPDGVVGVYRKLHLSHEDRAWAAPGDRGLPTFDLPLGRVGIQIGYDALFPEASRCLALDGADLIAFPSLVAGPSVQGSGPTAIPHPAFVETGPTDDHFHLWRERSRENCTYVAFANGAAPAMGWSAIFAPGWEDEPRREALIRGDSEDSAELTIDTTNLETRYVTNYARAKDLLGMRAPIWYDPLQAPGEEAAHMASQGMARQQAMILAG